MLSTLIVAFLLGQASTAQHVHPAPSSAVSGVPSGLTEETVRQLLAGEGMGLAKPAETNMYPGPKHVLELKNELAITSAQEEKVTRIRERMLVKALGLGRQIVEAERNLDAAFQAGTLTADAMAARVLAIAKLQGELRAVHLQAHFETRPLLTPAQIHKYYELRGGHGGYD